MRWVGYVACMGDIRSAYNIFVRKPQGKRTLKRSRHRWEDIRMDVNRHRVGRYGLDASGLG
jgi:hypothetical protein